MRVFHADAVFALHLRGGGRDGDPQVVADAQGGGLFQGDTVMKDRR